jgi:putative membrane protein insertion efficiency factor
VTGRRAPSSPPSPLAWLLIGAVRVYRVTLSGWLGGRCKYYPSCSQYALDAVREYGCVRGTILAAWRLLRCNPWSHGGFDPVR